MKMDLTAIIEQIETGQQDAVFTALRSYIKEVTLNSLIMRDLRGECDAHQL